MTMRNKEALSFMNCAFRLFSIMVHYVFARMFSLTTNRNRCDNVTCTIMFLCGLYDIKRTNLFTRSMQPALLSARRVHRRRRANHEPGCLSTSANASSCTAGVENASRVYYIFTSKSRWSTRHGIVSTTSCIILSRFTPPHGVPRVAWCTVHSRREFNRVRDAT